MRRFIPKSRMGVFTLIIAAIWVGKTVFLSADTRYAHPMLGFALDLIGLLIVAPAIYYLLKFVRGVRNRFFWKISRRLVLVHVFIGAIPVFLAICIFWLSALLFYYQLSYYLISNQIGLHTAQIHAFNLSLREGLHELMMGNSTPDRATLQKEVDAHARYLLGAYPSASITLSFPEAPGTATIVATAGREAQGGNNGEYSEYSEYIVPQWVEDREFNGLVIDDTQPDLDKARMYLRSVVYSDLRPDIPFRIEVSAPFDRYLLGRLKAALGQELLLANRAGRPGMNVLLQNTDFLRESIIDSTYETDGRQPHPGYVWSIELFPISWTTGLETSSSNSNNLLVELSTPRLMQNLFRSENVVGARILGALKTIVLFFLIVEAVSVVVGLMLTRSITNAVQSLDRGTEFVKRGDFSHRIVVRSADQLGALAASFNQMTEYVQHLVKERVLKERLERELEIAKEVQEQLFPSEAPQIGRLNLAGVCLPARVVSGDYYDFLPLGPSELGLAVGDICGKGISAALLMTNLQATLRSNVMNLHGRNGGGAKSDVARLVGSVNAQLFSYTAENKFASFFYAVYDDAQSTVTYCNAGHNPPLYFANGNVRRLTAGGTVVGVFADSEYAQETVKVGGGDLLVAYTDGIVESLNEYGEEFGEDRLVQLVREYRDRSAEELKQAIVDAVLSWTFSDEREDDMTLVIAKIV